MSEIEIVYVSRRSSDVTDADVVDGIVMPSMRFNRARDITACLWFGEHRFFHVLEGRESHLDPLYDRIGRDRRHHDVMLLRKRPLEARSFSRWAMKLVQGDEGHEIAQMIATSGGGAMATRSAVTIAEPEVGTLLSRILRFLARYPAE